MAHHPTELEKTMQRRLKALAGRLQRQRLDWLQKYPIGLEIEATLAIGKRAWPKLRGLGTKWRGSAERDLRGMKKQQDEWSRLWGDIQRLKAKLGATWQPPGNHPEWSSVRERMLSEAKDHGLTRQQVEEKLSDFERASVDDIFQITEKPVVWFGRQLDFAAATRFSALAAADLAAAVAHFNEISEKKSAKKPQANLGKRSQGEAFSQIREIYSALQSGRPTSLLKKARTAEAKTGKLLEALITAAAYHAEHDDAGINIHLGREAIQIANAIRAMLLVKSTARYARWLAGWTGDSPQFARWSHAAKTRKFASNAVDVAPTRLADIVAAPGEFDGKYVGVEGKVGPISIVHRNRKPISSCTIHDDSGSYVRIGLEHIKLDSGGLVMGAYARIAGHYSIRRDDFDTPVLVPDRRNFGEDSKTSWLDWLALEIMPSYWSVPHGLAIEWSWIPGRDGAGNLLQYGTWANERRRRIDVE